MRCRTIVQSRLKRNYTKKIQNYIGGKWVDSQTKQWIELKQPATNNVISLIPRSTQDEMEIAAETAQKAFLDWKRVPITQRVRTMIEYRDRINSNLDKLAESISYELGKTKSDAIGDVIRGLEVVEHCISASTLLLGDNLPNVATNIDVHNYYAPLGVCAGVCPFNFPAMIPLWMFPVAIVAGNTFLLKPSEKDPGAAMLLADLTKGLWPDGVLNIIHGGKEAVDFICDDPRVKAISFVGGGEVGNYIHKRGSANGKKVQSNMAAKNHAIIMPDAKKERTLDALAGAAFGATGQRCMALPVAIFVGESQDWIPELVARGKKMTVGPGHMNVDIGPVVTKESLDRIENLIQDGVKSGAKIILDGRFPKVPQGYESGNYINATILDEVSLSNPCYTNELFGPVLSIVRVKTLDDAIKIMNDNPYGNGCAIFTSSGSAARKFEMETEVGQIGVNLPIPVPPPFFSFTGSKASFLGSSNFYGRNGIKFFTQTKTVMTNWGWEDDLSQGVKTSMPVLGNDSENKK